MFPPVHATLRASADLVAVVASRIYRHGSAPKQVAGPYITWLVVSGIPENNLDDLPPVDSFRVQIDCWSENDGAGDLGVETLAKLVGDAVEPTAYMESVSYDGKEPDTNRYRVSMDFRFWTDRTS